MTIENQNYQSDIFEYGVNQHLNKLLPDDNEDALNIIANQCNDIVWRIATDIYKESGHQIDFTFIKNILNLKSYSLENQIAEEKRAKADLNTRRLFKKAEKERLRKEKEIADAKAKLEAERLEQRAKQKELDRERKEKELKKLQAFKQANPGINSNYKSSDIFIRIKNTIADCLEIDGETIKPNNYIMKDLEADELDIIEIVMAIEEEFDIEIPDDDLPSCTYEIKPKRSGSLFRSFVTPSPGLLYEDWNIEKMFYLVVQKI
ncbi:MAG: phosphopantetheine-binding protein [Cyanobacteria bacterium P01_A01_bin.40]